MFFKRKKGPRSKATAAKRREIRELDNLVREIVFVRDEFKCVRCGRSREQGYKLDPSHILPKGTYPRMRFEVSNVLTMCSGVCHRDWHDNPLGQDWFDVAYPGRQLELQIMARCAPRVDFKLLKLVLTQTLASWQKP